jgi:hypothetical protein
MRLHRYTGLLRVSMAELVSSGAYRGATCLSLRPLQGAWEPIGQAPPSKACGSNLACTRRASVLPKTTAGPGRSVALRAALRFEDEPRVRGEAVLVCVRRCRRLTHGARAVLTRGGRKARIPVRCALGALHLIAGYLVSQALAAPKNTEGGGCFAAVQQPPQRWGTCGSPDGPWGSYLSQPRGGFRGAPSGGAVHPGFAGKGHGHVP